MVLVCILLINTLSTLCTSETYHYKLKELYLMSTVGSIFRFPLFIFICIEYVHLFILIWSQLLLHINSFHISSSIYLHDLEKEIRTTNNMVISTHFVRNQHGHKTKKSFKDQEKYITQCDQMNVIKKN